MDFDDLTVEHIFPQSTINDEWPEEIVGSLGNLIFLDGAMNEKLGHKSYQQKIETLSKENYSLPVSIKSAGEWTPEEVIKHTEKMAEVAYAEIWRI